MTITFDFKKGAERLVQHSSVVRIKLKNRSFDECRYSNVHNDGL